MIACWAAFALFAEDAKPRAAAVAPVAESARRAAELRGVDFLVRTQQRTGAWGAPTRTKDLNILADLDSLRAFRVGTTALALLALCEIDDPRPAPRAAAEKGAAWLLANLPSLRRGNALELYNVWGHLYSLQALAALRARPGPPDRKAECDRQIRRQFELLERYECVDGGWGYYDFRVGAARPAADSTSFVNAAALVALHDARAAGLAPPERLVRRAVAATLRQRKPDFSYLYGEDLKYQPLHVINTKGGSLGRSQACNLALRLWGDGAVDDGVLADWLHRFFARHGWLDMGRKRPIPHESWLAVAGYFYYFGDYYAARCLEQLPPALRPAFQDRLARTLLDRQEADGSWYDYVLYDFHQQYGTAFALLSLHRCRKAEAAAAPER